MKISELPCLSFKALRQRLADQTQRRPMVVPTDDSDFCHTAVEREWLTKEQMTHAAMHYRLGRSRSGRTGMYLAGDDVPGESERHVVRAITREMCDALPEDRSCG